MYGDQLLSFAPYVEFSGFRRGRLLFGDGGWLRGFRFRRLLFHKQQLFVALTSKLVQMPAEFLVRHRCGPGGVGSGIGAFFFAGWSGVR